MYDLLSGSVSSDLDWLLTYISSSRGYHRWPRHIVCTADVRSVCDSCFCLNCTTVLKRLVETIADLWFTEVLFRIRDGGNDFRYSDSLSFPYISNATNIHCTINTSSCSLSNFTNLKGFQTLLCLVVKLFKMFNLSRQVSKQCRLTLFGSFL